MEWPNGDLYEGTWKKGEQNGFGIYVSNGATKYGEWAGGVNIKWMDEEEYQEELANADWSRQMLR